MEKDWEEWREGTCSQNAMYKRIIIKKKARVNLRRNISVHMTAQREALIEAALN